jgi:D-3-phosphoglycerate dehydrogenase
MTKTESGRITPIYIDCGALMAALMAETPSLAEGVRTHHGDPTPAELTALLEHAEVALNGHTMMDAAVLAAAPSLRSIVFLGTGAASYVDLAEAGRRGIQVRVVRGYGDRTVAEHAFGLLLAAARGFAAMDAELRMGRWDAREGVELRGKLLGVVGAGPIGAEMIRIAAGFGMKVAAWSRSGVSADLPCQAMPLDDLLRESDALSVHLALTEETRGFFDATRLSLIKPGALLVNVARGALFDEGALVDALRSARIRHAALDVFATEPLPADHPFTKLPNVTLTAHAAWKSREASVRLLREAITLAKADAAQLEAGATLAPQ